MPTVAPSFQLRRIRSTIRGPLILFISGLVLVIALLVLWNVVLAVDYQRIKALTTAAEQAGAERFHWTFIALGTVLFVATIALFSILGAQLIGEIRFSQRLGNFVATFTHELNSPLASIKLFAQTLRKSDLTAQERERFLELILSDVERLRTQLSNVLRAAQVDSPDGLQLAPEPLDLRSYLSELVQVRREATERLEVKATIEFADETAGAQAKTPVLAQIDRHVFRQALDNLIDNALKYGRPRAPVHVVVALLPAQRAELVPHWKRASRIGAADPDAPAVAIEVRDDGSGIPAEELGPIFERFRRVERGREGMKQQGTGLGLWIVRAIVEAHDGMVSARSSGLDLGATFRIVLPGVNPARPTGAGERPEAVARAEEER